ncbi:STAS domain-containing protein [Roseateles cellulosilyticus]|uniref:STAS domain-containing protein n=1 Tax=Pelomonas cellulosilytica TaxID=2906762 RepID=UPI0032C236D7
MTQTLALDGELTIYRASEICELLKSALGARQDLELNLSGVTELDSAGVQLLMAAKKSAAASQCALRLIDHSPTVLEVFEILNLAAHFGDPLLVPAVPQ